MRNETGLTTVWLGDYSLKILLIDRDSDCPGSRLTLLWTEPLANLTHAGNKKVWGGYMDRVFNSGKYP